MWEMPILNPEKIWEIVKHRENVMTIVRVILNNVRGLIRAGPGQMITILLIFITRLAVRLLMLPWHQWVAVLLLQAVMTIVAKIQDNVRDLVMMRQDHRRFIFLALIILLQQI